MGRTSGKDEKEPVIPRVSDSLWMFAVETIQHIYLYGVELKYGDVGGF